MVRRTAVRYHQSAFQVILRYQAVQRQPPDGHSRSCPATAEAGHQWNALGTGYGDLVDVGLVLAVDRGERGDEDDQELRLRRVRDRYGHRPGSGVGAGRDGALSQWLRLFVRHIWARRGTDLDSGAGRLGEDGHAGRSDRPGEGEGKPHTGLQGGELL